MKSALTFLLVVGFFTVVVGAMISIYDYKILSKWMICFGLFLEAFWLLMFIIKKLRNNPPKPRQ